MLKSVHGYCPLCRSRCGCISSLEEGQLISVEPDRSHPTGQALCSKGRAAPDLVSSPDRLTHPLRRTRPKDSPDPGWERISWEDALQFAGSSLTRLRHCHGGESVAFSLSSPSASAMSDSLVWAERFINLFGSPNICTASEYCNWQKDFTTAGVFGAGLPVPDYERTGCIVLWGFNPLTSWLSQAVAARNAQKRGARLIVVDPRYSGLARRADIWLQPRPGTDGILARGLSNLLIREQLFDEAFVRSWTTAPCLVREDRREFLRAGEVGLDGPAASLVFWDHERAVPLAHSASHGPLPHSARLSGAISVRTPQGNRTCWTAWDSFCSECATFPPDRVEEETGVAAPQLLEVVRLLSSSQPVSYYTWSGIEQHSRATWSATGIARLFALLGDFDAPGGNVRFEKIPLNDVSASDSFPSELRSRALGVRQRPDGPPSRGWITSDDLYTAILEQKPYPVRGLVALGSNLLASRPAPGRGMQALQNLEFHLHADLFLNPSARTADLVLPVCSAWEREGLRVGFEVGQPAENRVQLRPAVVEARGESRSDTRIIFDLASHTGFAEQFWNGDIDRATAFLLKPTGVTLEQLRARPEGIDVPLKTRFRKYRENGFGTPSGLVEIISPGGDQPPAQAGDSRFPLILTCAKLPQYCNAQHRNLPHLRRHQPEPFVEIHPEAAESRGIRSGSWVQVLTSAGRMRARARFNDSLARDVVCAQFGWWQDCSALGLPGYPVDGPDHSNFNALIGKDLQDPVSGALSLRSYPCDLEPISPRQE